VPPREYVSIKEIRDEGLDPTEFSDLRVRKLIQRATQKIDLFTKQFFIPEEGTKLLDGNGHSQIYLRNFVPFVRVDAIEMLLDSSASVRSGCGCGTEGRVLPDRRFFGRLAGKGFELNQNNRVLELFGDFSSFRDIHFDLKPTGFPTIFPEGSKNVQVEGVFGWQQDLKDVKDEIAVDTNILNDNIQVLNTLQFEEGCQLIIKAPRPIFRRVFGIDDANDLLLVDKIPTVVPAGTEIVSFGKIPDQIVEATIRLVGRYSEPLLDDGTGIGGGGFGTQFVNGIFKERIDNYEWQADPNFLDGLWNRSLTEWASTGDLIVDRILDEFKALPNMGYV